jgi:hypothetical protein
VLWCTTQQRRTQLGEDGSLALHLLSGENFFQVAFAALLAQAGGAVFIVSSWLISTFGTFVLSTQALLNNIIRDQNGTTIPIKTMR